jgi:hypothetical protein
LVHSAAGADYGPKILELGCCTNFYICIFLYRKSLNFVFA